MTKIIMNGCNGRMGQVISDLAAKDPDAEIVAGVDIFDAGKNSYPVFKSVAECDVQADVVIDFSSASGIDAMLDQCEEKGLPVVLCTTGLSDEQNKRVTGRYG